MTSDERLRDDQDLANACRSLLSAKDAKGAATKRAAGRTFSKADDGDRTRDPQLGKLMLYQLSYVRARPVYRAVSAPQLSVITTGAPISTWWKSHSASGICMRMQPCEAE